jgi:DNA primase
MSFVADLERNLWYCFSACGTGGDVVDLVRLLDGVGYREAAATLAELAREPTEAHTRAVPRGDGVAMPFQPFLRRLSLDPHCPFLAAKGILLETARVFEVGAWSGSGFLEGCVGVRLFDPEGHPLGYAGRRLDGEQGQKFEKWKLPPRLPKSRILYNAHRVRRDLQGGTIVVVECPWGVIRLHQLGVPAVALLGVRLSDTHLACMRFARNVLLLLDGDPAGRMAAKRIALAVGPTARILHLPDGSDPDDLPDADLDHLVRPFLSS